MNKLTKLMLASALLATSGFATEGTESILSGSNQINEGGIQTIANKNVVLTGSMTLATSDTAEKVAQLIVNEERTFEVRGGTLSKSGTGSNDAKITLKGTLKITEADPGEGKTPVAPNVDLLNVAVEGESSVTYWRMNYETYKEEKLTNISITDRYTLTGGTLSYGTSDQVNVVMWANDCYVKGGTATVSMNTFESLGGSSRWAKMQGADDYIVDMNDVSDDKARLYAKARKVENSKGTIDLSSLRPFNEDAIVVKDYSADIKNIKTSSLGEVKLPFNCKFSGINLTNVESVTYDVLKIGEKSAAGINSEDVITRVVTVAGGTYGDYKGGNGLGVTTGFAGTEHEVAGDIKDINLSAVVADESLNKPSVKLDTDCLTTNSMEIASVTTYKFGLKGATEISVTKSGNAAEGTRLVLAGDNSKYEPTDRTKVIMPDVVEFAESNSLLPFTFEYGKGIFSGSSKTNSIASGINVEFDDGIELAAGHTLEVSGSLTL